VARIAEIMALEQGVSSASASQIRAASVLHDIGKIRIPAAILNKPGKRDAREFEIMKTHTTMGAELLSSITGNLGTMSRAACLWHHEHHNGGGYWGKTSPELPPYVPIISIADVFVALVSRRPYKEAWPLKQAVEYIENQAGTQFSPELVKLFTALIRLDGRLKAIYSAIQQQGQNRR
jgi:putative two-component system response regulator